MLDAEWQPHPLPGRCTVKSTSLSSCGQVASILRYLGEHVTLLTSMNLRDYLYLKVWTPAQAGHRLAAAATSPPMSWVLS